MQAQLIKQKPDLIPPDIKAACKKLGWTPLRVNHFGDRVSYLIEINGLQEPYSREAILGEAGVYAEAGA